MSLIVEVKNLRKQYDPPKGIVAVKDVSFNIRRGEIFSLLGPNGAGKTTIISMLSCLLKPSGGDALINNCSVLSESHKVRRMIGVVPQEIALYPAISARENLAFWGKMYGMRGPKLATRITEMLELAGLADRSNDNVSTFSTGMRRRLNIVVGLLHEPDMLYLDEPTVGVDPQSRRRILDTIKELRDQGLTVLYTTHYMEEAQELSDRIGVIDSGQVIALGTLDELMQRAGAYQTIQLTLESPDTEPSVTDILAELRGVEAVTCNAEQSVLVRTRSAHDVLPQIISRISEGPARIQGLTIQEPNLEAVFLHLTGRALRDDG
jgi:ABC-2 type transport system ATP-binding protein